MRPGQRTDVIILFAWIASAVAAAFVGRTIRDTLFLAHEGAARLPIMYIASPLSTAAVGLGFGRIAARIPRDRLVPATALAIASFALVLRLSVGQTWMYYALYILTDVGTALMPMLFWVTAGERFTPREAKRMFSLLAAGGTVATIGVGIAVTAVVQWTGAENLLFAYSGLLATVAVLAITLARRPAPVTAAARPRAHAAGKPAPGASHLKLLAPLIVLTVLALTVLDFQYKSIAAATYANDRVGMVRFFGIFYVATAAASLAIQLLLARRILAHAGIAGALLVMPMGLGLAAVALLISPSLVTATACKAAQVTFRPSINDAGMQLLYLPVPAAERRRRKATLDTVVSPTAEGTVGLLLMGYRQVLTARAPMVIAAIVAVVAWIAIVLRVRGAYVRAITETLRRRRIDPEGAEVSLASEDARAVRDALASSDDDVVRRGLDLARMDPAAVAPELRALLAHGDAGVRGEALACLAEVSDGVDDAALADALADPDPGVRAMAARAWATCGSDALQASVAPLLADPDPRIATAAAESLHVRGDAAQRAEVVARVRALLADPDRRARRRGLDTATAIADAELAPALLDRLADRHDAAAATVALAAIGPAAVPALDAAIAGDDQVRAAGALAALGRLAAARPGEVAIDKLVAALADKRERVRDAAAAAFAPLRRAGVAIPAEPVVEACRAELYRAFTAMGAGDGLGNAESVMNPDGTRVAVPYQPDTAAGPAALISRSLRERAERAQARMFELLAALEPDLDLPTVRANLRDPDPVRRANAVELLDARRWPPTIAPLKQLALCVVDDSARAAKLAAASKKMQLPRLSRDGWIDKLLSDREPWIRTCAAYYAGAARDAGARPHLTKLADDRDPLVAETARAALRALDGTEEQAMLTTTEKVLFLKGAELFAQIPGEDVAAIAAVAEEVRFDEGDVIFRSGDPGDALYLVVEGNVRITSGERKLAELGCREVFGEMALLDPAPRSATAIAATPVVAVRLDQDDFGDVLAQRPEVAAGVLRVVVRRLRAAQQTAQ